MSNKQKKLSVAEELESLAPRLARLKEQEPAVDIPTAYFDQLSEDLFRQIREEERSLENGGVRPWTAWSDYLFGAWRRPAFAVAFAGLAALLIAIVLLDNQDTEGRVAAMSLSEEDINDYINYHIDDFDLNLLAEEADDESEEPMVITEEDSLDGLLPDEYFDQLIDDMPLDELL